MGNLSPCGSGDFPAQAGQPDGAGDGFFDVAVVDQHASGNPENSGCLPDQGRRPVSCSQFYLAEDVPNLPLTVSNVVTIDAERTFWDTVVILHGQHR